MGNINTNSHNFVDICKKIEKVIMFLPKSIIPLMIGGDHSLSYSAIKAIHKKFTGEEITLVHFDHHNDMQFWGDFYIDEPTWLTKLTHANFISWLKNDLPNLQSLHLGVQAFNYKLHNKNIQAYLTLNSRNIYVTFDVDVIKHS